MRARLKPLSEQTIVITGASSGIGLATAETAAEAGARVVLVSRNEEALAKVRDAIVAKGGEAIYAVADVADEAALKAVADKAREAFGGFDTWVNDAGAAIYGEVTQIPDDEHRRMFETNYWGVVNGSRIAVAHFRNRPGGGALINVGSVVSDVAIPLLGAYSATKHAVKGFTDALRTELMHDGAPVSVTLVKPSGIGTPFAQHAKNYLPSEPRVAPPTYAPEVVARAILSAAQHPTRDVTVGGGGRVMAGVANAFPNLADRIFAAVLPSVQKTGKASTQTDSLFAPAADGERHSPKGSPGRPFSLYTMAVQHPVTTLAIAFAGGAILSGLCAGRAAERTQGRLSDAFARTRRLS